MPILKKTTAPNGAPLAFHKARNAEVSFVPPSAMVNVSSWPTQEAHDAGASPLWSWPVPMPLTDLHDIDGALLATDLFRDGIRATDATITLDGAKTRQWQQVKADREREEFGGFTWDKSTFDSDPQAQSRIQGGAQLATLAMLGKQEFLVDWTLADNTVRTLNGDDMLAAGRALGAHVMFTHATGRRLREAILAAATLDEVQAVEWPAG